MVEGQSALSPQLVRNSCVGVVIGGQLIMLAGVVVELKQWTEAIDQSMVLMTFCCGLSDQVWAWIMQSVRRRKTMDL